MAIDTYSKLQSEILDTVNRTDLVADITEYSPGTIEGSVKRAIAKAEKRIVRRLKTREFETSTTISMVAGTPTISTPSDHLMTKAMIIQTNPNVVLVSKDMTSLINDFPGTGTNIPSAFSLFGSNAYLRPTPDAAYSVKWFYYYLPTPLSDSNTSNIILTTWPDLLLYGSLIELTAHIEDDNRIQLWKGAFDEAVKDITNDNMLNRWSGAPQRSSIDVRLVQ